jgi:hypothetical protein
VRGSKSDDGVYFFFLAGGKGIRDFEASVWLSRRWQMRNPRLKLAMIALKVFKAEFKAL